ncbi:MAG: rRNA methyltransferase [Spirochaetaceae bacterium]|jgi:hypothetical protein|nr:rRNA methyltransferase [Spirochaetaceae bacterium]
MTRELQGLLRVIEETFPMPGRFRSRLPGDVAELSRLLTGSRSGREGGYLNRPNLLSAYLRYFLPWNIFRLHRLFSFTAVDGPTAAGLSAGALPLGLADGDAVTDLGSGPLTLPVALWLYRPELRERRLEFRCVDSAGSALEAGKKLLAALTGGGGAWKIRTIHDSLDAPVRGKKAALVTALNVFNELSRFGDPGTTALAAKKAAGLLERSCAGGGTILVMEPGVPGSGAFIAALRRILLEGGKWIAAPCTHGEPCPLPGLSEGGPRKRMDPEVSFRPSGGPAPAGPAASRGKAKWCHFAFDTAEAPAELQRLSVLAGLPKERAVFSFLAAAAGPAGAAADVTRSAVSSPDRIGVRIVSDPFPLPGLSAALKEKTLKENAPKGNDEAWGRYGCSERGLVLVAGSRKEMERAGPGNGPKGVFLTKLRDPKTGIPVAVPFR